MWKRMWGVWSGTLKSQTLNEKAAWKIKSFPAVKDFYFFLLWLTSDDFILNRGSSCLKKELNYN